MNRIAMLLAVVAIVMAAVADAPAPARAEDRFDITVVSKRADLISGGDALIEFGPPLDAQCNVPTKYEFFYRATSGSSLQGYDPNHPASDVSMTTTDQGRTVPFIVRRETGVIDRGWYSIAVLFDPTQPWVAWAP